MKITTKVELENTEVEELLDVTVVYGDETIGENVVQTCVEGLKCNKTGAYLSVEDAMEKLFAILRANYIIPSEAHEFSYELFTCERFKSYESHADIPKNLVITYVIQK
ncbi:hypothetical protein IEO70_10425 [Bacillus sp. AGMB 02131]|uniref:Uncharacterized protein n=1 Tax=Peribacillus faecalis TaxID=2772559 RepID=A0A927CVY2_9BACI|nr:hypothetical protein [Peribacillus faecalis]MBD3108783.1 hypothetical protein [Peribacillus faecalis]